MDPNRDKIDHDPSDEPQAQALQYKLIKCGDNCNQCNQLTTTPNGAFIL